MDGPIAAYMTDDHRRLDSLLGRAVNAKGEIDPALYGEFRVGLLRHIGMEEKILFPLVARLQEGRHAATAAKLKLDHGALAALLVPEPSLLILNALRGILASHNLIEEGPGGFYEVIERLTSPEAARIVAQLRATPQVRANPTSSKPEVLDATRRALARAGYDLDAFTTGNV